MPIFTDFVNVQLFPIHRWLCLIQTFVTSAAWFDSIKLSLTWCNVSNSPSKPALFRFGVSNQVMVPIRHFLSNRFAKHTFHSTFPRKTLSCLPFWSQHSKNIVFQTLKMCSSVLKWATFNRQLLHPNRFLSKRFMARMLSDPENRGSRQQHINFDILGIWDNRMDFTILFQQSIKHGMPIPKITCENAGHASLLGRRETNEDRLRYAEYSLITRLLIKIIKDLFSSQNNILKTF